MNQATRTTDWTALRKSLLVNRTEAILPPKVKLPMLPRALNEFSQRAQDPNAEGRELSRIIGTDAGLSSELLRHVNSCAVGARSQITSVQQALAILGIRSTQLYLMTSGLRNAMKSSSSKLVHFESFWNTNLERALLAREVAALVKADTEIAFTAGMLQDFLLPVLANQLFDDYLEFSANREEFTDLASFERNKFGWDHTEAAAQIMVSWNLPDELVCGVYLHHKGRALLEDEGLKATSAAAVAISSLLPDALRQVADGLSELVKLEETWDAFELLPVAEKIDEEFREMATSAVNHFPFLRACQKAAMRSTTS